MRKFIIWMVLCVVAVAGCAKKETRGGISPARKLLVEGTVYLKQGDVANAIQSFASSIKADPNSMESYYMLAETLIRLKQFPQALAILMPATERFPKDGLPYYMVAIAHEGSGNLMPAIVAARKSVDVFTASRDEEGFRRATVLLATLVAKAKEQNEAAMVENAAKDAGKAVEARAAEAVTAVTAATEAQPVAALEPLQK
jgi:tetratricopeptide (TPR) repeat protein